MKQLIDLSHEIRDGLVTYPGIPEPKISEALSREASKERYAPGTEFLIGRIDMAGNTGTYLDTPNHRYPDGFVMADLDLDVVAGLPNILDDTTGRTEIRPDVIDGLDIAGQAVLFRTGWSVHFGTPAYATGHPHLDGTTAAVLVLLAGVKQREIIDGRNDAVGNEASWRFVVGRVKKVAFLISLSRILNLSVTAV